MIDRRMLLPAGSSCECPRRKCASAAGHRARALLGLAGAWAPYRTHNNGRQHRGDEGPLRCLGGEDVGLTHGQRATWAQHPAAGKKALAPSGREQVDLELHGQDIRLGRGKRVSRVAVRGVCDTGDGPRVHEPVLLAELRRERKYQMHFTRRKKRDRGPQSGHVGLAIEALPYPRLVGRILGYHMLLTPQCSVRFVSCRGANRRRPKEMRTSCGPSCPRPPQTQVP